MEPEKLLAKADEVLDKKGWCTGALTEPDTGAHCSLGAIGYAKFGKKFDNAALGWYGTNGNGSDAMEMLTRDPDTRAAIIKLGNQIRKNRKVPPLTVDDYRQRYAFEAKVVYERDREEWVVQRHLSDIMSYNDNTPMGKKARVRKVFAKAAGVVKKIAAKKPESAPMEVEYIPAKGAEVKEEEKEIA